MSARLFVSVLTISVLLFQSRIVAQQRWQDSNGYTYEVYDFYTQGNQRIYPQHQQKPTVTVSEAQWVCTNQRTNDMMIIASEDIPRFLQAQAQQPTYPQQQPSNPQQPSHPQQPTYPNQQPATPSTTEEPGPIWSDDNNNIHPNQQPSYLTTQKPVWPTTIAPVWPVDNGSKPGFTIVTPKPHRVTPTDTSSEDLRPQLQPEKPSPSDSDPNDYGEIKIEMGKK